MCKIVRMKCQNGNVGELITTCICLLMLTILMTAYLDNVAMLEKKTRIEQLARRYILIMETEGYLSATSKTELLHELEELDAKEISLDGTTLTPAGYGQPITLRIRGKIKDNYEFYENKASTAKY